VSSQAQDASHAIAPLSYSSSPARAKDALVDVIKSTSRTRSVSRTKDYSYAEYESALMGFVDGVEFWFDLDAKIIHVRAASRLGYSDFGVNRARIEDIRRKFSVSGG
jgi:uncharacterized protein (DUF1499 family)